MVKVSAADVGKLRKMTGAGMMDCKNALVEAEGNFDKAVEVLRKKGQKVAAKRADRESSEGLAIVKINDSKTVGVAMVLACETDFVGKNDSFKALATEFVNIARPVGPIVIATTPRGAISIFPVEPTAYT